MNDNHDQINENEIRIICAPDNPTTAKDSRRHPFLRLALLCVAILALLAAFAVWAFVLPVSDPEYAAVPGNDADTVAMVRQTDEAAGRLKSYISAADTVIDGRRLLILTPFHAVPSLVTGMENLADTSIILAAQAADLRADNRQIVGTFVMEGRLIGKGESKAGFCAIINGDVTVGVADATPLLEQALDTDGYFFRQYPLVVGGQIVENKPRGRAKRKALAEIDGKICVAASTDRLSFHDFSQLLVDAGARNAIYLVGSSSHGFYTDMSGNRTLFGIEPPASGERYNYIVWKQK